MRAIGEVQDAPVIADLDTGYGNAVNVAYLVPRYAAAGVAAVTIEDKTFPKDSSLRPGGRQVLVSIEEFQGKIEAARLPDGPLVVARTEALIAGLGQAEALRRGAAYAEAGADAVLIHSKEKTPDEVLEFCRAWPGQVPLVLVPTAYPQLTFVEIAALGKVGLIICANHAIRAAVAAMRATFSRILSEGGIAGVEGTIATVAEFLPCKATSGCASLKRGFCVKAGQTGPVNFANLGMGAAQNKVLQQGQWAAPRRCRWRPGAGRPIRASRSTTSARRSVGGVRVPLRYSQAT